MYLHGWGLGCRTAKWREFGDFCFMATVRINRSPDERGPDKRGSRVVFHLLRDMEYLATNIIGSVRTNILSELYCCCVCTCINANPDYERLNCTSYAFRLMLLEKLYSSFEKFICS